MRQSMMLFFAATLVFAFGSASNAEPAISQQQSHQMGRASSNTLCSRGTMLDMGVAKRLRDELDGHVSLTNERKLQIAETLNMALTQCGRGLDPPDAEFFGGLYVLLGNGFLSNKAYSRAKETFETTDRFYSGSGLQSLGWLEALRGEASADIRLGNLPAADKAAEKQTQLARSWVAFGFVHDALVDALRFQAKLYELEEKKDKAKALLDEANRLESGE
jgi:tetratricopeptide (TPR) repeat protein